MYVVASHKCWTYAVHRRTPLKKKGVAISQYSIDNRHYFQASVDQCTTRKIGAMFQILADALLKCSPWLRSRLGVPSSAGSLGFSARFAWTSSTWLPRRRQKRMRKLQPCTCAVLEAWRHSITCLFYLQALFLQITEYSLAGDYCHGVLAAQAAADTARQLIKALASLGSSDAKQARHHYQQPHEEKQLY